MMPPLSIVVPLVGGTFALATSAIGYYFLAAEEINLQTTGGAVTITTAIVTGIVLIMRAAGRFLNEERAAQVAHQAEMLKAHNALVSSQAEFASSINDSNLKTLQGIQQCATAMTEAMIQSRELLLTSKIVSTVHGSGSKNSSSGDPARSA